MLLVQWFVGVQVMRDEFVMLNACNVSHIAKSALPARDVRPDDHTMHLVVARKIGRCGATQALLELETDKVI